jgi:quercetin dioxygenase-like cupin family protein
VKSKYVRALLLVVVGAAVYGGVAFATMPSGLTNTPLARGTNSSNGTIPLQFGTDVAMAQISADVGGSSGWHSHPGGAVMVVQHGTLTTYRLGAGGQCQATAYNAGQAFIERPGEVIDVLNTGTDRYSLFVVFPRVPQGVAPRTDEANPDPSSCPG